MLGSRSAPALAAAISGALALPACTLYTGPPRLQASGAAAVRGPSTVVVAPSPPPAPPPVARPAFVAFEAELSPHGEWLDAPVCGRRFGRVWRPSRAAVGVDFVPYASGGEWVSTDQGWSFESDWSWGWAPFHYGRWCADPRFGWVWIPGQEWAPAWVDWRLGGGYVGWAPLPPAGVVLSGETWVFVEGPVFARGRPVRYSLPRERIREIQRVTRPVRRTIQHQGYSWQAGPPPSDVVGDGPSTRPVHVAPPARGEVRRVIVRSHR